MAQMVEICCSRIAAATDFYIYSYGSNATFCSTTCFLYSVLGHEHPFTMSI